MGKGRFIWQDFDRLGDAPWGRATKDGDNSFAQNSSQEQPIRWKLTKLDGKCRLLSAVYCYAPDAETRARNGIWHVKIVDRIDNGTGGTKALKFVPTLPCQCRLVGRSVFR